MSNPNGAESGVEARDYAALRARLGFAVTPKPRVRLDLVRPTTKVEPVPVPEPDPEPIVPPASGDSELVAVNLPPPPEDPIQLSFYMQQWRVIAREVAVKHGVALSSMFSVRRDSRSVAARHEAFWRCKQETAMTLPEIGRRFGGRDHTTVLHGIRRHEQRMAEEKYFTGGGGW